MRQITMTARQTVELLDAPHPTDPLRADVVEGRTLVTLTSPGTELNYNYLGEKFPTVPGYASVFEITAVGDEVTTLQPGTVVFAAGRHADFQRAEARSCVPLPAGVPPEQAVFVRLAGVSMSTLATTAARPPARVLVTGLGPVGNLAAQVFAACGYQVTAVDPVEARRETARQCGLTDVRATVEEGLKGKIQLHLECSGHEQGTLDGCEVLRKGGECVLIGVPWRRHTELHAAALLKLVFHNYVHLRSGWEWEVPRHAQDFQGSNIHAHYEAAMSWLAEGRLQVAPLLGVYSPAEAPRVYAGLLDQTLPTPAAVFGWHLL